MGQKAWGFSEGCTRAEFKIPTDLRADLPYPTQDVGSTSGPKPCKHIREQTGYKRFFIFDCIPTLSMCYFYWHESCDRSAWNPGDHQDKTSHHCQVNASCAKLHDSVWYSEKDAMQEFQLTVLKKKKLLPDLLLSPKCKLVKPICIEQRTDPQAHQPRQAALEHSSWFIWKEDSSRPDLAPTREWDQSILTSKQWSWGSWEVRSGRPNSKTLLGN